ncbi:MAG: hypothetical protein ACE365_05605 [Gammaproteobacteria bacterium]
MFNRLFRDKTNHSAAEKTPEQVPFVKKYTVQSLNSLDALIQELNTKQDNSLAMYTCQFGNSATIFLGAWNGQYTFANTATIMPPELQKVLNEKHYQKAGAAQTMFGARYSMVSNSYGAVPTARRYSSTEEMLSVMVSRTMQLAGVTPKETTIENQNSVKLSAE